MLTYAAGTIRPAKVLVIGAGVAGLQAIATAKRLGAMVSRLRRAPGTKEQIESLGAKVRRHRRLGGGAAATPELTDEEKRIQATSSAGHRRVRRADHHRRDPRQEGAADRHRRDGGAHEAGLGGRRHGGRDRRQRGRHRWRARRPWSATTLVIGPTNIPAGCRCMPPRCTPRTFNFISPFIKDGVLGPRLGRRGAGGACLTHAGEIRHAGVKAGLGL